MKPRTIRLASRPDRHGAPLTTVFVKGANPVTGQIRTIELPDLTAAELDALAVTLQAYRATR